RHAALDARLVADDGDVGVWFERDPFGIATSHVEVVEVRERAQTGNGLLDPLAPLLVADSLARGVAELLVEGLTFAERLMSDFEMGKELPVQIQSRAEPGAQRDHHLQPLPLDDTQSLHVRVVQDADGLPEAG